MLSATKMVSLAAVTALVGSVMLVAGPLSVEQASEQTDVVGGPSDVAAVHGTFELTGDGPSPNTVHHDWGAALEWQLGFELDVDEPRLRGDGRMRMNEYDILGLPKGPTATSLYVENDEGAWSGEAKGYRGPDLAGYHFMAELAGHGGYDGLTAILMGNQAFYGDDLTISGLVYRGAPPPMPGPADE